ncbi:MAG: hypothetical protein HN842_08225 [Gammaproteobacteria bacterium]|jgi:hypothetical protein|nr:hypothetical protein [Gammaproteobacteria bacterium]
MSQHAIQIVLDTDGNCTYGSFGHFIGTPEQMLEAIQAIKPHLHKLHEAADRHIAELAKLEAHYSEQHEGTIEEAQQ